MENSLDELNKYILENIARESLLKEDSDVKVENHKEKEINLSNVIKRMISKALLEDSEIGFYKNNNQDDPKVLRSLYLIRTIQDSIYKIQSSSRKSFEDSYYDEEIENLIYNSFEPIIKLAVSKLHHLWLDPNIPKPDEKNVANSIKIVDVEPGDNVVSPQGTEYNVEEIVKEDVLLKEKISGKKTTANINIVKKWKQEKK